MDIKKRSSDDDFCSKLCGATTATPSDSAASEGSAKTSGAAYPAAWPDGAA